MGQNFASLSYVPIEKFDEYPFARGFLINRNRSYLPNIVQKQLNTIAFFKSALQTESISEIIFK